MASLNHLDIFLEFEPIVKLVCENADCQFNLINAANNPDERQAACNLKQIVIGNNGQCKNFEPYHKERR